MTTHNEAADLGAQPGRYERSAGEMLLDAGASFDWITPSYALVRNVLHEGVNVTIDADLWHTVKAQLQEMEIPYWGENLWYDGAVYRMTVSLPEDDIPALNELLADGGAAPVHSQGRMWQWLGVLLVLLVVGSVVAMVAAVAGAL